MGSDIAIRVKNITKAYQIYDKPQDRLKQSLWRGRKQFYREFKALDNVSFEVKKGETVGIIGRNGSYQHNEKFIPTVIRKCLEQESIPVYGDGSNIRDWLYVTDHCSGIDAVVRKGELKEVYNIGDINEWKNIDICRLICLLMDEYQPENALHNSLIPFVTDRPGHDWRYAIDATKMNDKLNWEPAETFETEGKKLLKFLSF